MAVTEAPSPRLARVGPITRAAVFYGACVLSACSQGASESGSPPTQAEAEAMHPVSAEPMAEAEAEAETEASEAEAYAVGPVELEPEAADVARRERAHAEDRKRAHRLRTRRQQQVRQLQRWQRDIRIAPPYGAPPGDFPVV